MLAQRLSLDSRFTPSISSQPSLPRGEDDVPIRATVRIAELSSNDDVSATVSLADSSARDSNSLDAIVDDLAAEFNVSKAKVETLLHIWKFIKGLAEWRRDDPDSVKTDMAELIDALEKYEPDLYLSEEDDGYLLEFIEARHQDISMRKLLETMCSWDPFLGQLETKRKSQAMRKSIVSTRKSIRKSIQFSPFVLDESPKHATFSRKSVRSSQKSDTSGWTPIGGDEFGLPTLMKKLFQSANAIEHSVQRGNLEQLHGESKKLTTLAGHFNDQMEDAIRFIRSSRQTRSQAQSYATESIREIEDKCDEKLHIVEKLLRESEDTVTGLQEERKTNRERIQKLTEELERSKRSHELAMLDAKKDFTAQLQSSTQKDKLHCDEKIRSFQKIVDEERKDLSETKTATRLQMCFLRHKIRTYETTVHELEPRVITLSQQLAIYSQRQIQQQEEIQGLLETNSTQKQDSEDLKAYIQELERARRISQLQSGLREEKNVAEEFAEAGTFLGRGGVQDDTKALLKRTIVDLLLLASLKLESGPQRDRIDDTLSRLSEGEMNVEEMRALLYPLLVQTEWIDDTAVDKLKWKLGVLYRCVHLSRRRPINMGDVSSDDTPLMLSEYSED